MKVLFICCLVLLQLLATGFRSMAEAIRGKLPVAAGTEVRLYSMQLHHSSLLATVKTEKDSIFKVALPPSAYHGFYLLRWPGGETELLYDGSQLSFTADARGQLQVVRGQQWQLYRENRQRLLELRQAQGQLDSLLQKTPADAFGYGKIKRKYNRKQRQLQKLKKSLLKAGSTLWSRSLLFEFDWIGYTPARFAALYPADSALNRLPLADTLGLCHNRWPNFMLHFVAAYAPASLSNADSALLHCSQMLIKKAKEHPAYLKGSLQFLQMGMQALDAQTASQWLQREKNLFVLCFDPEQASKQALYAQKIRVGDPLPQANELSVKGPRLMVFWSAECMPCLQEITDLHLWLKNNRPEIEVLAIALDATETGWLAEKQAFDSWTHVRLSTAWNNEWIVKMGINRVPYYGVIDATGKITALYEQTASLRNALER